MTDRTVASLARRLFDARQAAAWGVSLEEFTAVLESSVEHGLGDRSRTPADLDRYVSSLHASDLLLAAGCAAGHEAAWEHFVRAHRPVLYRAADAIDPSGRARESADALYGELFGLKERAGERQSLFRYFHGRSSLATWLRAVLSQRYVDRLRTDRRFEPLADAESAPDRELAAAPDPAATDPSRPSYVSVVGAALASAIASLSPRNRLRLGCYYVQQLTLAQIGRMLGEHEATVSRHLAQTRRDLRVTVERRLREDSGLDERAVAESLAMVAEDPGALDVSELIGDQAAVAVSGKNRRRDRSR